jgi:high-affinity nickel-transport protein
MNFAYGWAFSKPVRKVYYNITITGLSVVVAVFIGGLEVAQVLAGQLNLTGGFWSYASNFNINHAGFIIAGMFVVVWVAALAIWRFGRVEQRWESSAALARMEAIVEQHAESPVIAGVIVPSLNANDGPALVVQR